MFMRKSLTMVEHIVDISTKTNNDMAQVHSFGQIAQTTTENGLMIRQTAMAPWYMVMEIFMKGNGLMIKPKDRVHTHIRMEQSTLEIGLLISRKDMVSNHGQMGQNMRAAIWEVKNLVKETLFGLMDPYLMVTSRITTSTELALINGQMTECM